MSDKVLVISLFALTYLLIVLLYHWKALIVWAAVAAALAAGLLRPRQALGSVDWNVVLLYFGMLLVSEVFLFSRMPDYLATVLASRSRRVVGAMVGVCMLSGALSAALENVAVVLLVAPIALSISRRCQIHPAPLLIGIAVSSNLQGAATLIGDPPSMLLAGFAGIGFNDFFVLQGRPSIFFAVQIGALAAAVVLYLLYRRYDKPMPPLERQRPLSLVPAAMVGLLVAALATGSALPNRIPCLSGLTCCVFGVASLLWYMVHNRGRRLRPLLGKLDWQTGVFLIGIFMLVESLEAAGVMNDLAQLVLRVSGGNRLGIFLLTVSVSMATSALVDNVPLLMAMLPVIREAVGQTGGSPYAAYFALLLGASIGGNITPVGAAANVVAMGILKKQGHPVRFMQFVRIGLPFTLASLAASSLFIWLMFG